MIDPALEGPKQSGGRPGPVISYRDAKLMAAEKNRARPLRGGKRDVVVLRSHRTHRGLRWRPENAKRKEPDSGSMLIGGVQWTADGEAIVAMSPFGQEGPACRSRSTAFATTPQLHPRPATAGPVAQDRTPAMAGLRRRSRRRAGFTPHHPALAPRWRRQPLPVIAAGRVRHPPLHQLATRAALPARHAGGQLWKMVAQASGRSSGHCCAPCSTRRIRIVSPVAR